MTRAVDEQTRRAILGHVIAHELGHLLLGEAGHPAGAGIMRVPWGTKELQQAKQGTMRLLPWQSEQIRAQVLVRTISGGRDIHYLLFGLIVRTRWPFVR